MQPALVELCTAPQRSGETLQSAAETRSVGKLGCDPAESSKAACRFPPSFRSIDEIRSKFVRPHQSGDHCKKRHYFHARRCANYDASCHLRHAPGLFVQV